MKVVTVVRTLNEERNVERFIHTHQPFSDEIVVADGGSTDATLDICSRYANVVVVPFEAKIQHKNGTFRNPEGEHMNFSFQIAEQLGADWIVQNDCDNDPNPALQQWARWFFEMPVSMIKVLGLFVYKWDRYFPALNAHKNPEHIWAWRTDAYTMRCEESNTTSPQFTQFDQNGQTLLLPHPPFAILKHDWQDEEQIHEKFVRYKQYGWYIDHPEKRCGVVEPLPEWAMADGVTPPFDLVIL